MTVDSTGQLCTGSMARVNSGKREDESTEWDSLPAISDALTSCRFGGGGISASAVERSAIRCLLVAHRVSSSLSDPVDP